MFTDIKQVALAEAEMELRLLTDSDLSVTHFRLSLARPLPLKYFPLPHENMIKLLAYLFLYTRNIQYLLCVQEMLKK